MNYVELNCSLPEGEANIAELIMAALGELGFESFVENENGLLAYIQAPDFDVSILNNQELWPEGSNPSYTWKIIEDQNWNALWESNFDPVIIDGQCMVRAPFHPKNNDIEFDIEIEPKMSFGTAHHETTAQIISLLLNTDVKDKTVLDMGCGTGVLAILAAMKGASKITAIDNDEWAYHNSVENTAKNNLPHIDVYQGDAALLEGKHFDILIANINRNILLNDMHHYRKCMTPGSILMMSGFYTQDVEAITTRANELGLSFISQTKKNNWATATFVL
ncbi:MAG: 50S ribosomal protein L11 methyltransferase [Bacteroidetes bacterium HGW-Bacteroidetes-11]|jgi:ribosomal protein L11 methyltransferase|nr:MAG: 50S ribosomal protein L11 methyltransferase [Bacteroidetes bacterium HGW-Bacteroidetes-11]